MVQLPCIIYLPVAEMTINVLMLIAMGLAVGVLSGLFGIGGGFIVTPLLIFLGVPAPIAVGTGAAQVAASSVSGAVSHWVRSTSTSRWRRSCWPAALFGSMLGVFMQRWLKAIGQLELFISLGLRDPARHDRHADADREHRSVPPQRAARRRQHDVAPQRQHHNWIQRLPLKTRFPASKLYISWMPPVALGVVVGWLTAIMGVGGGFLLVPALIYLLRMPTRVVIGTSVMQIMFVTAFTTVMQSWQNQSVDLMLGCR